MGKKGGRKNDAKWKIVSGFQSKYFVSVDRERFFVVDFLFISLN